jgi:hypothetical protein
MWYRQAKAKKFKYRTLFRQFVDPQKTKSFADETEGSNESGDNLEQIDTNKISDLMPDLTPNESNVPDTTEEQPLQDEEQPNKILVDSVDPPPASNTFGKIQMPPPIAQHDGCKCGRRLEQFPSGAKIIKIDEGMCPVCQNYARDYNNKVMNSTDVNSGLVNI